MAGEVNSSFSEGERDSRVLTPSCPEILRGIDVKHKPIEELAQLDSEVLSREQISNDIISLQDSDKTTNDALAVDTTPFASPTEGGMGDCVETIPLTPIDQDQVEDLNRVERMNYPSVLSKYRNHIGSKSLIQRWTEKISGYKVISQEFASKDEVFNYFNPKLMENYTNGVCYGVAPYGAAMGGGLNSSSVGGLIVALTMLGYPDLELDYHNAISLASVNIPLKIHFSKNMQFKGATDLRSACLAIVTNLKDNRLLDKILAPVNVPIARYRRQDGKSDIVTLNRLGTIVNIYIGLTNPVYDSLAGFSWYGGFLSAIFSTNPNLFVLADLVWSYFSIPDKPHLGSQLFTQIQAPDLVVDRLRAALKVNRDVLTPFDFIIMVDSLHQASKEQFMTAAMLLSDHCYTLSGTPRAPGSRTYVAGSNNIIDLIARYGTLNLDQTSSSSLVKKLNKLEDIVKQMSEDTLMNQVIVFLRKQAPQGVALEDFIIELDPRGQPKPIYSLLMAFDKTRDEKGKIIFNANSIIPFRKMLGMIENATPQGPPSKRFKTLLNEHFDDLPEEDTERPTARSTPAFNKVAEDRGVVDF